MTVYKKRTQAEKLLGDKWSESDLWGNFTQRLQTVSICFMYKLLHSKVGVIDTCN